MKNLLLILVCILAFMNCQKEFGTPEPADLTDNATVETSDDRSTCNCAFRVTNVAPYGPNQFSVLELTAGGVKYRWNDGCNFIFGGTPDPFTLTEMIGTWYSFPAPSSSAIGVKLKFIANKNADGCFHSNAPGVLTYQLRCGANVVTQNGLITNSFQFTGTELQHNYVTDQNCGLAVALPE